MMAQGHVASKKGPGFAGPWLVYSTACTTIMMTTETTQ